MARNSRSSRSGAGRGGARGSGRGGNGRGRAGPPPRKGGGTGATVAAVFVVVGVIALVVFLTSGKKQKKNTNSSSSMAPIETPAETQPTPEEPAEPTPPPYPTLPASLKGEAEALAERARELGKDGEKYYTQAGEAKAKGKDDIWQEKLEEAAAYYLEINESWNQLIEQIMEAIPDDCPYDAEEVANHHFPNAAETVRQASKRLGAINKDRR